ncbi:hypothetical protein BDZ94DRAFT_1320822 [Collybia nuda]|uniref:J domain-containing protein n=1 Tax=Collybia nuda TaxID=64659 RepID=A0A9P5Y9L7_9AGAR|nr:hypothetical protein BDZ94DRAFT_1320822 [Collybia nuda]
MDQDDPISQFFPNQEFVDLYDVLSVKNDSKTADINKAYRRLALANHPDKHVTSDASTKADASVKFQQIGFAYAVLSDEKRRLRYDTTGRTDEGFDLSVGDDGWEAYFEELFERVTREKLDEMKKEYQGSPQEIHDLKDAYIESNGSIEGIMSRVPHSTYDDEARFIITISELIMKGDLPSLSAWEMSSKDEKSKLVRKKQSQKEAKEAEKLARELGVWDEFYGSGKTRERKSKGKSKGNLDVRVDEEDHSTLQALILGKKRKNMDSFFDSLATKYTDPGPSLKARRQGKKQGVEAAEAPPQKKSRLGPAPEIDDEEFDKLQQKLFGDRAKPVTVTPELKPKQRAGKKVR